MARNRSQFFAKWPAEMQVRMDLYMILADDEEGEAANVSIAARRISGDIANGLQVDLGGPESPYDHFFSQSPLRRDEDMVLNFTYDWSPSIRFHIQAKLNHRNPLDMSVGLHPEPSVSAFAREQVPGVLRKVRLDLKTALRERWGE